MIKTKMKPVYKEFEGAIFLGSAMLKGELVDVYLTSNEMKIDSIIVVHGNEEHEHSSFHSYEFLSNFIGTPTYELAKHFYYIAQLR